MTSTFVSCGRRGTNSHLPSFCVAGVALMGLGGALGPGFVACDARGAAPLCVAGVALGDIYLRFTWQAWHLVTSTFVSHGRRGTNSHLPSFCVAGVALMVLGGALGTGFVACDAQGAAPLCVAGVALGDIHLDITWQAWHKLTSTVVLRGRRVLMVLGGALGPLCTEPVRFHWLPHSCCNKIARMKPLCACY